MITSAVLSFPKYNAIIKFRKEDRKCKMLFV
jgi:hypothetical protein